MDYEKAYKDALERAKQFSEHPYLEDSGGIVEYIFPELKKESEDEKIRKAILNYLTMMWGNSKDDVCGVHVEDAIAWLEKQGKQASAIRWYDTSLNPEEMRELLVEWDSEDDTWHEVAFYHADTKTFWDGERQVENVTRWCYIDDILEKQGQSTFDKCRQEGDRIVENPDGTHFNISQLERVAKVEPKFKDGDIIKHNKANIICKVISVNSGSYYVENIETSGRIKLFNTEQNFHLWTIQDAKDGDVLKYKGCTFIFKKTEPSDIVTNIKNPLTVLGYCGINHIGFEKTNGWGDTANCKYHPATKEQRELLFQKMHEAGYEWDAGKKELRKMEQKPKWSEEDEELYQDTLDTFEALANDLNPSEDWGKLYDWLKSLKQRMEE